jgi:hypothetical protein
MFMERTRQTAGKDQAPCLAASKRFGNYKDESQKPERYPDIKSNKILEKMTKALSLFIEISRIGDLSSELNDRLAVGLLEHMCYSSNDVEQFSLLLSDMDLDRSKKLRLSHFFNGLVTSGQASSYTIHTAGYGSEMIDLTLRTPKELIVNGDAGFVVGCSMSAGKLIINGDARSGLGSEMSGGLIVLNGNFIHDNDPGYGLGEGMTGGEIHLNGDILGDPILPSEIIRKVCAGRIYHKGRLIVDK